MSGMTQWERMCLCDTPSSPELEGGEKKVGQKGVVDVRRECR